MRIIHGKWVALLALVLALAGCGRAGGVQPATAPAATAPPAAPAAATPAPTATTAVSAATTPPGAPLATPGGPAGTPAAAPISAPVVTLPAPLYINEAGTLYRIARDGLQREVIAGAPGGAGGISEFDVSPAGGRLIYIEQQRTGRLTLAGPDGSDPQVLLEGNYFIRPLWSPDGAQVALGVMELIGAAPPTLDPGVYLIPAAGGTPWLLQRSDRAVPGQNARAYVPQAWSPDGQRLLLRVSLLGSGDCELAVIPAYGGPALLIAAPEGLIIDCQRAVWRGDGGAIAFNAFRRGSGSVEPGLWQADPDSGAITELVSPQGPAGWTTINSLGSAADAGWLGLVAFTAAPPAEAPLERQVAHIAADGAITLLRPERYLLSWWVFAWAPGYSGLAVRRGSAPPDPEPLLWLPFQGDVVELYPPVSNALVTLAWGAGEDDP